MSRFISDVGAAAIVSLALLAGCADEGDAPEALADGGWGGPARLANCRLAEICELEHWASRSDFEVVVPNEDAEVSISDATVLEVVSVEPTAKTTTPIFCFGDCSPTTFEYLSVIVHTMGPGDAEFVIDGPAGDQRRLPIHVVEVERFQLVDEITGNIVTAIEESPSFLTLEAYSVANERLSAQGEWSVEDPDAVSLSVGLFEEQSETLDYSATALVVGQEPVTTTLRISIGETSLDVPVEF